MGLDRQPRGLQQIDLASSFCYQHSTINHQLLLATLEKFLVAQGCPIRRFHSGIVLRPFPHPFMDAQSAAASISRTVSPSRPLSSIAKNPRSNCHHDSAMRGAYPTFEIQLSTE